MYLIMVLWQLLSVEESGVSRLLSFDNSSIVSKFSKVDLSDINLTTKFTKKTKIAIPFVLSQHNTDFNMTKQMTDCLGVGILNSDMSIENQSHQMKLLYHSWHHTKSRYIYELHKNKKISDETKKDLDDTIKFLNKLPKCASIKLSDDFIERAAELYRNGCNVIFIDSPHGYNKLVGDAIGKIKKELSRVEVIAGSVNTEEAIRYLCESGADAITIGVGSGYEHQKANRTGYNVPEISTIVNCSNIADSFNVPIIGYVDTNDIGDVCKGLGAGADSFIMDSYITDDKKTSVIKIDLQATIDNISESLKSSLMFVGAKNIDEFHSKVDFIKKN